MPEDLFHISEPEPPIDLATGDGVYVRKPRVSTLARPVPDALKVLTVVCLAAAVLVAAGWYASDRQRSRTPHSISAEPMVVPDVVIDGAVVDDDRTLYDVPDLPVPCAYQMRDLQRPAELPAPVNPLPGHTPRLVLRTNHGRIVVLLNGWAGRCAINSTVSLAAGHRLDGVRCRPVPGAKALRCNVSVAYAYRPQLVEDQALDVIPSPSMRIDADGTLHLTFPEVVPSAVAAGKRGGLLTTVAGATGFAGGDLVLAYADTTLPAGSFYPTLGEVDEGGEVLSRIGAGLTITSATVE